MRYIAFVVSYKVKSCAVSKLVIFVFFFFQAEDCMRDLVRSRGLGDVYKRQVEPVPEDRMAAGQRDAGQHPVADVRRIVIVEAARRVVRIRTGSDRAPADDDLVGERVLGVEGEELSLIHI